jgi:ATP-dependent DNA helicase RecG
LVKSEQEITRAAILLFGKTPQSPLTQAVVHAGRQRKKVHIMDNRFIEGPIIEQVDETVEFIKKNLHVRFEITGEPERKEIWDYPLTAIREAVTSAVICHRDYGNVADIQIKIFEDALQIWSPGYLPFIVTVDDLFDPEHASSPRNKLIAQVFYDIGLIERYGNGIQRILDACRDAQLPEPLLENFSGGFRIRFALPEQMPMPVSGAVVEHGGALNGALSGALSGALKQDVLKIIQENPGINRKAMAENLEISSRTVDRYISTLASEGKIERRGSKKTGGYFLTESDGK